VNYVAKWDGSGWSDLGDGVGDAVSSLTACDGKVYAGGRFATAGGAPANSVAVWDGSNWSTFGSGIANAERSYAYVYATAIFGDALLAGGSFARAGGKVSAYFAQWMPRVNRSRLSLTKKPGAVTLGDDPHGFYKPSLTTLPGTQVSSPQGFPVEMSMRQADEIQVGGVRIQGALTIEPEGVRFMGRGATLRVEFSEDDAAAFEVSPEEFRAARFTYAADYPQSKEAASFEFLDGADPPIPVRIENGRQIWAIDVSGRLGSGTYGAFPVVPPLLKAHFMVR